MLTPYERQRLRQALKGPARPPWLPPAPPLPMEPFPVRSALAALSEALISLKWLLGVAHNGRTSKDLTTVGYVTKAIKRLDHELQRLRGLPGVQP